MCSPRSSSRTQTRRSAQTSTGIPAPNMYTTRPSAPGVARLNAASQFDATDVAFSAVEFSSAWGAFHPGGTLDSGAIAEATGALDSGEIAGATPCCRGGTRCGSDIAAAGLVAGELCAAAGLES